jgi:hypothetical protein
LNAPSELRKSKNAGGFLAGFDKNDDGAYSYRLTPDIPPPDTPAG